MEALSILERVERLERLNGITGPAICHGPTGEGGAWQGAPAEPAPGSDAEHPPEGYRLEPVGGKRAPGYIFWSEDRQAWIPGSDRLFDVQIDLRFSAPIANPIPANEGDSQKAESGEIQKKLDLQWEAAKALEQERNALITERDELRATVERLTAENASLEVENRTLRGLVRRMKEVLL